MKTPEKTLRKLWTALAVVAALAMLPLAAQAEEPVQLEENIPLSELLGRSPKTAAGAEAPEEPLQLKDSGEGRGVMSWIALVLLGGAAFGALVLLKRKDRTGGAAKDLVSVLHSTRLAGKWQLSLVQVPGRLLVLGVTDKGISLLTEIVDGGAGGALGNAASPQEDNRAVASLGDDGKPNPFLDRILNVDAVREAAEAVTSASANTTPTPKVDSDRRDVLRRLENYTRHRASI